MMLWQVADACKHGLRAGGLAEHGAAQGCGPHHGHDDLDKGALSGAVWPKQPKDLARLHGQRNPAQRLHAAAVGLGDIMKIDRKHQDDNRRQTYHPAHARWTSRFHFCTRTGW